MTIGGVPDSETARQNGRRGGGDHHEERECPLGCGETTKRLGHHLPECDAR